MAFSSCELMFLDSQTSTGDFMLHFLWKIPLSFAHLSVLCFGDVSLINKFLFDEAFLLADVDFSKM